MKKLFACASLVVAMMLSTSAMAAVTPADTNISVNAGVVTKSDLTADSKYKTVLIYKGTTDVAPTEENIEYVNTYSTAISSATTFALKNEGANGKYVMMLGGAGTLEEPVEADTIAFEITTEEISNSNTMTQVAASVDNGNGTKNLGFTMDTVTISNYNSVIVDLGDGDKKLGWDIEDVFGTITGDVTASVALEVRNVPADKTVSVYFSTKTVEGGNN